MRNPNVPIQQLSPEDAGRLAELRADGLANSVTRQIAEDVGQRVAAQAVRIGRQVAFNDEYNDLLDRSPSFIPAWVESSDGKPAPVELSDDDKRYLEQRPHGNTADFRYHEEDEVTRKHARYYPNHGHVINDNLSVLFGPEEAEDDSAEEDSKRSFSTIIEELSEARSATAQRHWKTKKGTVSEKTKEFPAPDITKEKELLDELSTKFAVVTINLDDDQKLSRLVGLQKRLGIEEDDISKMIDRSEEVKDEVITVENIFEPTLEDTVRPKMREIIAGGKDFKDFFEGEDGKASDTYVAIDKAAVESLSDIEDPIVRELAANRIEESLREVQKEVWAEFSGDAGNIHRPVDIARGKVESAHQANDEDTKEDLNPDESDQEKAIEKAADNLLDDWNEIREQKDHKHAKKAALKIANKLAKRYKGRKSYADTDAGQAVNRAWARYSADHAQVDLEFVDGKPVASGDDFKVDRFNDLVSQMDSAIERGENGKRPIRTKRRIRR